MLDQHILDLYVSGNRLFLPGLGVQLDIMTGAVALENAPCFSELLDELLPFHTEISMVR